MEGIFSLTVNIIGIIFGLIFVGLNIKARRSLIDSFFKNYYRWMIIGAVVFTFGFFTEFAEFFGVNKGISEGFHHSLLVVAGIVFVLTSLALPKEASQYIKSQGS
jgi:hypothetical protein